VADNETLIQLFGRIQSFLQRLKIYVGAPLTNDFTGLLGDIMAQVLLILALSTKAMTTKWIGKFSLNLCTFLAEYDLVRYGKKLLGKQDVGDALQKLDTLTKEETSMAVAKNYEVACRVEGKMLVIESAIDQAVKALKERTQ